MERMMATINEEWWEAINGALADGTPCLVGTVSGDGQPQISPKGSGPSGRRWPTSKKIKKSWSITAIRKRPSNFLKAHAFVFMAPVELSRAVPNVKRS